MSEIDIIPYNKYYHTPTDCLGCGKFHDPEELNIVHDLKILCIKCTDELEADQSRMDTIIEMELERENRNLQEIIFEDLTISQKHSKSMDLVSTKFFIKKEHKRYLTADYLLDKLNEEHDGAKYSKYCFHYYFYTDPEHCDQQILEVYSHTIHLSRCVGLRTMLKEIDTPLFSGW